MVAILAAGVVAFAAVCLVVTASLADVENQDVLLQKTGADQLTQILSQTSIRTDVVHPYDTMHMAENKFVNPDDVRGRPVNAAPHHPYHAGSRPRAVHHPGFEHEPFGNKFPWQDGPEGAVVKYEKRPDKLEGYHYMVDTNGLVKKWTDELPLSEVRGGAVTSETLKKLSPMKEPDATTERIAQALLHKQQDDVQKSFRNIDPHGAFHDSIIDGKTGKQIVIPDVEDGNFECLPGLVKCQDNSCVAHVSYCPGCGKIPVPDHCTAYDTKKSGWSASAIGCDPKDLASCGMLYGNSLYEPGEAVTGGVFDGGLA
eukprot:CAMPEP_0181340866 /NCGR_PEP_ID=MMETSP1101-20121128/30082_1 /TAXON_ID=46948 /ORGANISM="Rhodomonas abbreviata, Strain Caron Lab Isolate" /LENGTH=312 /DNA_ID=CAMNT_0023452059 /DNA_START=99 /DNA_END=1037 /DNA_ORIENTATION=+